MSFGISHGCFCTLADVKRHLSVTEEGSKRLVGEVKRGYKPNLPRSVRISVRFCSTKEEIDQLIAALGGISRKEYKGKYSLQEKLGEYLPEDFPFNYQEYSDFW